MLAQIIVFCFFISLICVLGTPTLKTGGRIVGGEDIPIEKVPWQISLQSNGIHCCGGSIIAPNYIVTAAHCIDECPEGTFTVLVGTSTLQSGGQVVNIQNVYKHPNHSDNPFDFDFDIAILELTDNLEFTDKIAAIALPTPFQTWPAGTEVLVSGWGTTKFWDWTFPINLQAVTVEIVDLTTCRSIEGEGMITDRMLCAGVDGGGKDACSQDSGGPLEVDGILAGVISWGVECALPNHVGVYANVSALRDFIEDVTGL